MWKQLYVRKTKFCDADVQISIVVANEAIRVASNYSHFYLAVLKNMQNSI